MFFFRMTKLKDQALVDAVKIVRGDKKDSTTKERNTAYKDILDTFGGLIGNKIKSIKGQLSDVPYKELEHHLNTSLIEVLSELDAEKLNNPANIVSYVNSAFNTKINVHSIKRLLGKDEIMPSMRNDQERFRNARKTFKNKYNKFPDLDNDDDLKNFAEIMGIDEDRVKEILHTFSTSAVRSMEQEVAGGDDDSAITLLDTLSSNTPLPDEVYENHELMKTFSKEIERLLEPEEKKVIRLYYHLDDPAGKELTNNELAKETGLSERMVRHWIAMGRKKLEQSEILKKLHSEAMIKSFIKFATNYFKTPEQLVFEIVCQK
jgi:RNA polymerase sigma factor (sigma-70 family)